MLDWILVLRVTSWLICVYQRWQSAIQRSLHWYKENANGQGPVEVSHANFLVMFHAITP